MTGLNHAVTGAVIAVAVQKPVLALPAALLSHFAIDVLPHWDYKIPGKPHHRRLVIGLDLIMSAVFIVALAYLSVDLEWLVLACGFLAIAPDSMWLPYILQGKPSLADKKSRLYRLRLFHFKIQWSESRAGLIVEMLWFAAMLQLFLYLVD